MSNSVIEDRYMEEITALRQQLEAVTRENERLQSRMAAVDKAISTANLSRITEARLDAEDKLSAATARVRVLEESLGEIDRASRAYPRAVFPEPDLAKARALLEGGGMSLDSVSAFVRRDALKCVGKIARDALAAPAEQRPATDDEDSEALSGRMAVARDFRAGMACAILCQSVPPNTSEHWGRGWKAGKDAAGDAMNAYLVKVGMGPFGVVRIASKGKPRNHGIEIDGQVVVVPCGNLRRPQ